ncbi:MAG: YbhN family protein, partial [Haloglomus sp.]
MSHDGRAVLDFASRKTLVRILVGFAIAIILLSLVAVGIGTKDLAKAFRDANPRWLVAGCLSTFVGLVAWGRAWQVVLEVQDIDEPFRKIVVTYFAATFANYVTPLGQAGGEPFIAYVLSRDTDASYEESLASVVTADLLNLLPFFSFAAVGMGWLLWQANLPTAAQPLAMGLLALAVGVPAFTVAGWRFRRRFANGFLRLVAPIARRTPRITLEGIRERLHELGDAFNRIAAEPTALGRALVFSYVGWVFFAAPLYFAGRTVGVPIGPLLVLFIVPASTIAGLVPSPGGLGGVELALTALLIALVGLSEADAYAISLVYRLMSYWFAIVVGGIAAMYVVAR